MGRADGAACYPFDQMSSMSSPDGDGDGAREMRIVLGKQCFWKRLPTNSDDTGTRCPRTVMCSKYVSQKRNSRMSPWIPPSSPTQSIMYVPLQVNRSQKCILLTIQYKYIKSCSGNFYSPESDPPHKIMRYWVYYSTQVGLWISS